MEPRRSAARALLVLILAGSAIPAEAGGIAAQCKAICRERNMEASCDWLAQRPRRCKRQAVRTCVKAVKAGLPATCAAPPDLPACLTHHGCPFGSLCVGGACEVVPCTSMNGLATCTGMNACQGDKCVVADCAASTENCPAGLHCKPAEPPFQSISGTCQPDDPGVTYCTASTDCITPGTFDLVCERGQCVPRPKRGKKKPSPTTTTTATIPSGTTTSTTLGAPACADVFDCPANSACCSNHCVPDPYAGMGVCSTLYTPACTLCADDDGCVCNGIFCDTCEGTASLSGCVDPCS